MLDYVAFTRQVERETGNWSADPHTPDGILALTKAYLDDLFHAGMTPDKPLTKPAGLRATQRIAQIIRQNNLTPPNQDFLPDPVRKRDVWQQRSTPGVEFPLNMFAQENAFYWRNDTGTDFLWIVLPPNTHRPAYVQLLTGDYVVYVMTHIYNTLCLQSGDEIPL